MKKLKVLSIAIILVMLLASAGLSANVSARPLAVSGAPGLGAADSFSALAALSASSATTTTLQGDLGLSPGLDSSITGNWVMNG